MYFYVIHNNNKTHNIKYYNLMVLGYMFRPYCSHLQANFYRLSALNVRTIWDLIVCTIMTYVYLLFLCVFVVPYVYLLYYVCIAVLTLDAGLLARSQYPEGPATGHLDTGFYGFHWFYKRKLRWFPSFQVATTCLSCSPPDLNFLVTFFFFSLSIFVYM